MPIDTPLLRRGVSILVAASALLTAGAAFAFSRNISGSWTRGKIRMLVAHDPAAGSAVFTIPLNLEAMGANRLVFKGGVAGIGELDETASPNAFMFHGELEPISGGDDKKTCTLAGTFGGVGTVLGQVPNRKLRMDICNINLRIKCDNGKEEAMKRDCSGDWK